MNWLLLLIFSVGSLLVEIKNNDVYVVSGATATQPDITVEERITHDGEPKLGTAISPDANLVLVVLKKETPKGERQVVIYDRLRKSEKKLAIAITWSNFVSCGWIDNSKFFIGDHVNIEGDVITVIDLAAGTRVAEYAGSSFAWNSRSGKVAYVGLIPMGAPGSVREEVFINKETVFSCSQPRSAGGQIASNLLWVDDNGISSLHFVEDCGTEMRLVTVAIDAEGGKKISMEKQIGDVPEDRQVTVHYDKERKCVYMEEEKDKSPSP